VDSSSAIGACLHRAECRLGAALWLASQQLAELVGAALRRTMTTHTAQDEALGRFWPEECLGL